MYKYYVEVQRPVNPQKPNKHKKLSQFQIKLIAIIGIALIIAVSGIFYIINKISNPTLIKILVEPSIEYDYIPGCFDDDLIIVINEEPEKIFKCGIINKYGKIIAPVVYDYLDYDEESKLFIAGKDGKYGFIDKTGKIAVPLIYDRISYFKDGLAAATKDGKCGYIYKNGNVIIDFIYTSAYNFSEGLALYCLTYKILTKQKRVEICQ